ncbi:MAG: hypothetical protein IPP19_06580 [Verrucomicrobia bacterium]|nr:hypothetical protein [Verrucomicrobiota bacterium]
MTGTSLLRVAIFVALVSAAMQFWLVAHAGTDIPILDQWDTEGKRLLPSFLEGHLRVRDLFIPHNEHRIVFTHLLDIGLFYLNGSWDPFSQLMVGVGLRSLCVLLITVLLCRGVTGWLRFSMAGAIIIAFIPVLDWHNVLWGFQSHVWFVLGYSVAAILCLEEGRPTIMMVSGCCCLLAAMMSMGAGYLLPVAILVHTIYQNIAERRFWLRGSRLISALVCFLLALVLHTRVPELEGLRPSTFLDLVGSFLRVMAWPHSDIEVASLVMNAPMALLLGTRIWRHRPAFRGEESVTVLWLWGLFMAAASAWSRGGGAEFQAGLPSRYVDFIVLILLANCWSLFVGVQSVLGKAAMRARLAMVVWLLFAGIGWIGLVLTLMRGIIIPRIRDREAPVRLAVSYQYTRDPVVFIGQPKFYVPHPNFQTVDSVLNDPRLAGRLPPSFQPSEELGWISAIARAGQRYSGITALGLLLLAVGALLLGKRSDLAKKAIADDIIY